MRRISSVAGLGTIERQGFTLLELLIVTSILAAVAFIVTGTFVGVNEEANNRLVRAEMQQIAQAIRQFKADTGYFPKTGPFALSTDGGEIELGDLPDWAGDNAAEQRRWFYSPANFYQLYGDYSPLDADFDKGTIGHQLEYWNPETGRGWKGPYLLGHTDGYVSIGDDVSDGTYRGDVEGDAALGTEIPDVPGIADPFEHTADGGLLAWRAAPTTESSDERNPPLAKWGRPYLLLDIDTNTGNTRMGLVSMGEDGVNGTDDDAMLYLE